MADPRLALEARLLGAALLRQRGATVLAVLAVAIGASVASAMLHVTADISRRLEHELRALGPNVLVVPPVARASTGGPDLALQAGGEFLDEHTTGARLAGAGLTALPVLYAVARIDGEPVALIGTDLGAARALHPQWRIGPGGSASLVGGRLMRRLGLEPGGIREVTLPGGARASLRAGAALEAGGADDEAWWLPLPALQRLAGLDGRVSLYEARIEGGADAVAALRARLEPGGGLRVMPVGSLTAAESQLLGRMRRLMLLVTLAALVAAGLCALGTLTDRVLEQRRDFALMKSLGAGRRRILRQFAAEAVVIGLAGGVSGWSFGLLMAEVIGREVFHTAIAVHWAVPPIVIGLALAVALLSSVGPARMALAVEPATALKGE